MSTDDFLTSHEFGEELRRCGTESAREFLNRSREFIDRLVDLILEFLLVSADLLQGVYAFCPELMLEGDNQSVFQFFSKLLREFERSGSLSSEVDNASSEEFTTYVIAVRARHCDSGALAEEISDVVQYLLNDYCFAARRHLCQVLKLCCLVLDRPHSAPPRVMIDLSGCKVSPIVISSALSCVKSYVLSSSYQQGAFFTQATMVAVRGALSDTRSFMSDADFDPWSAI